MFAHQVFYIENHMQELELITHSRVTQDISDALLELGAVAVTLRDAEDNPILEPPPESLILWPSIKLTALFTPDFQLDEILLQLYALFGADNIHSVQKIIVEDQDWVRETQRQFHPMCFGEHLWIYPSWEAPPENEDVKILLDPGIAFGTGTHPTTGLILTWLAKHSVRDQIVLDYGCGSGILAIAAAKLGAKQVWCTDIDPQALRATRENAQRNQIFADKLFTIMPDDLPGDLKAHTILANILAEPLLQLAPYFYKHTAPGGHVILSGILAQQAEAIKNIYQTWFNLENIYQQNEWLCVVWKKSDNHK